MGAVWEVGGCGGDLASGSPDDPGEGGTVEPGAIELGPGEVRAGQIGVREIAVAEIGASKGGALAPRPGELGTAEGAAVEGRGDLPPAGNQ